MLYDLNLYTAALYASMTLQSLEGRWQNSPIQLLRKAEL
jgi:hypothetical protein